MWRGCWGGSQGNSRPQYVEEGLRQLEDKNFYSKLESLVFQDLIPQIEWRVDSLVEGKYICQQQAEYLLGEPNPKPRRFYLLPKVHKPKDKWPTPWMPPGRPIVKFPGSRIY